MEEQESGLSAPKPSLLSAAELVSPVWWCGGSNENREAHRVAGSRRQVLCSPIRATVTCRGYTWRASGALIAPGGLSACCAVAASAVCGGPQSRVGGGAARGILALAASERRAAVLSRLADVADSWWSEPLDDFTALPQLGFFFRFCAWEMVERLKDLNFKMSSTFFLPSPKVEHRTFVLFSLKKENLCTSKNDH